MNRFSLIVYEIGFLSQTKQIKGARGTVVLTKSYELRICAYLLGGIGDRDVDADWPLVSHCPLDAVS